MTNDKERSSDQSIDFAAGVVVPSASHHDVDRFQRAFDILIGSAMLVILAPLILVIILAITLTSRGPILFTQARIGRNGETIASISSEQW